jgi:hypothetical protein
MIEPRLLRVIYCCSKREIPAVNFTIHSVHCARNIKMCPVCKEPVPLADLELHHEQMHKLRKSGLALRPIRIRCEPVKI